MNLTDRLRYRAGNQEKSTLAQLKRHQVRISSAAGSGRTNNGFGRLRMALFVHEMRSRLGENFGFFEFQVAMDYKGYSSGQ
jgi:hypothetical protein